MSAPIHRFRHEAMATWFEIRISAPDGRYAQQAARACFERLDDLERLLSRFDPNSEVARISHLQPGEATVLAEESFLCLQQALEIHRLTGGAFDPTLGSALDRLRGQGPAVDAESPRGRLELDPDRRLARSIEHPVFLDLGGIGKGFALDQLANVLAEWDLSAALLIAGGSSILALDPPEGVAGWPVQVGSDVSTFEIQIVRVSVGTSGRAVKGDHIIDPLSGHPAIRYERAWAFSPTAAISDALSTAWMALTPEEVAAVCKLRPSIGAILQLDAASPLLRFGAIPDSSPNPPA
jgi:FAD:protein FMN transferase